jgi:2-oxoglutarate dehydrogenase E1 component
MPTASSATAGRSSIRSSAASGPIPELEPSHYGFTEADLGQISATGSLRGRARARPPCARSSKRCGRPIAAPSAPSTCTSPTSARSAGSRASWSRSADAGLHGRGQEALPAQLTQAETLERYLHTKYVGQKRFSLEGGESLILAMDQLVRTSPARSGVQEMVIGMAHRGRLNVLVNTLGKQPSMLFDEFEGKKKPASRPATSSTTWATRPTSAPRAARCT